MKQAKIGKIGLLAFLFAAIAAFFIFDLGAYLTLDSLKARQADLATLLDTPPLVIIGGFFLIYVATTALSLPGAVILTLAAGAVFGLWLGTLIVSFASAIGASLAEKGPQRAETPVPSLRGAQGLLDCSFVCRASGCQPGLVRQAA